MKSIQFLALFLFICNVSYIKGYSQIPAKPVETPATSEATSDKATQDDEYEIPANIPVNNVVLQELLNDNKQQITDVQSRIHHIEEYSGFIQMTKSEVSDVDGAKIEAVCKRLVADISKNNVEADMLLRSLRDKVEPMLSVSRSAANMSYGFNSEGPITSQDFANKMARAIAPLKNNEITELLSSKIDDKAFTLNKNTINLLLTTFTAANINGIKNNLIQTIQDEIDGTKQKIDKNKEAIKKLKKFRNDLLSKQVEEKNINSLAITLGLPLFCGTILCLFIIPSIINKGVNPTPNSQNVIVEISTVLLLTMSILILGLATKIASDVLGTLIGGISGYVLNRIRVNAADKP